MNTSDTATCDCPSTTANRKVSRRGFLKGAAAAGVVAASSPMLATQVAFAADTAPPGDTLVLLSLRGGFDGLNALVPVADPEYYRARPTIAVPASQAIALDRSYGFHPALAPLKPFWDSGQLAAVNAVGSPFETRSHFEAREEIERAAPGTGIRTGYLNRVLGGWGADTTGMRAVRVGGTFLNRSMFGPLPVMALNNLSEAHLAGSDWTQGRLEKSIYAMRGGIDGPAAATARLTLDAFGHVSALKNDGYQPAVAYPQTWLGDAMRDIAHMIKANIGVRLVTVDFGDFDSHSGQGDNGQGQWSKKLGDVAASLAAFAKDLGPALARTNVVTMSEFGRRVAQNGSGGTDHGKAGVMFLLGGGIAGGRVYGRFPGLAPSALDDGDLRTTTDYRDVLGEVLVRRSGVASLTDVFPGHAPAFLGAARPR